MAVVKEPVMERNMSQLREGSLSLNPGRPGNHDESVFSCVGDGCTHPSFERQDSQLIWGQKKARPSSQFQHPQALAFQPFFEAININW